MLFLFLRNLHLTIYMIAMIINNIVVFGVLRAVIPDGPLTPRPLSHDGLCTKKVSGTLRLGSGTPLSTITRVPDTFFVQSSHEGRGEERESSGAFPSWRPPWARFEVRPEFWRIRLRGPRRLSDGVFARSGVPKVADGGQRWRQRAPRRNHEILEFLAKTLGK